MDPLTPQERSRQMATVQSQHTKPEIIVRKLIHALGFRYRLHRKNLPGCPDLVFPSRRKVVFVNGCFWHWHNCKRGRRLPKTNRAYWTAKVSRNVHRDRRNRRELRREGWRVFVIWECQTRPSRRVWLTERTQQFLEET